MYMKTIAQGEGEMHAKRTYGFTLIELLVVISIISLLIAILLPSLASARKAATKLSCATQLHQWGIVISAYSHDSKGYFPQSWNSTVPDASDATDSLGRVPRTIFRDVLVRNYSMIRPMFYCPANDFWNKDSYWERTSDLVLTGYFHLSGAKNTAADGHEVSRDTDFVDASTTVLMADRNESSSGGSSPKKPNHYGPNLSPAHVLAATLRSVGGNILYADGHTAWKPVDDMLPQAVFDHRYWW